MEREGSDRKHYFISIHLRDQKRSTYDKNGRKKCIFTISALNNFGLVSTLHESIINNSAETDCFVWFLGDNPSPSDKEAALAIEEIRAKTSAKKNFLFVTLADMEKSFDNFSFQRIAFSYDLVEFQTTIKPFAFQFMFP